MGTRGSPLVAVSLAQLSADDGFDREIVGDYVAVNWTDDRDDGGARNHQISSQQQQQQMQDQNHLLVHQQRNQQKLQPHLQTTGYEVTHEEHIRNMTTTTAAGVTYLDPSSPSSSVDPPPPPPSPHSFSPSPTRSTGAAAPAAGGGKGVAKRFSKMIQKRIPNAMSPSPSRLSPSSPSPPPTTSSLSSQRPAAGSAITVISESRDHHSVSSENATVQSADGIQSTATGYTESSHDTVKVSNATDKPEESPRRHQQCNDRGQNLHNQHRRWTKIKRIMGAGKKTATVQPEEGASSPLDGNDDDDPTTLRRQVSADEATRTSRGHGGGSNGAAKGTIERKRIRSAQSSAAKTRQEHEMLDHCIRGRLDGVDILSLGGAQRTSMPQQETVHDPSGLPWDRFPVHSFAGESTYCTPAQIVAEMLWSSAGRTPPEMIFEGGLPGGNDRWTVRIEATAETGSRSKQRTVDKSNQQPVIINGSASTDSTDESPAEAGPNTDGICCPTTAPAEPSGQMDVFGRFAHDDEDDDGGSPNLPTNELWSKLWGSDPPPANLTDLDKVPPEEPDSGAQVIDPLLHLAAECSIPIDVDENTFIISKRDHLRSIHEIASVELAAGKLEMGVRVFEMLLRGMTLNEEKDLRFLVGSTLHNIGVIHMWRGEYEVALACFQDAVDERMQFLPKNHPDVVVSMIRKAQSFFALDRIEEAVAEMEVTLPMIPDDHLVRAKALNNLGVFQYHRRDLVPALECFAKSLEVQRHWLDKSIRREALVYDAATTLNNMGKLYMEGADYERSYFVYEEALLLQTTIFRRDHDVVLSSLTNMALSKGREGQTKKSLHLLHSCLRLQNKRFGPGSQGSVETVGFMGYMYAKLRNYNDALVCLTTVRKWQMIHLEENHPALKRTTDFIQAMEERVGLGTTVWI